MVKMTLRMTSAVMIAIATYKFLIERSIIIIQNIEWGGKRAE
jgi:hypothetical protein